MEIIFNNSKAAGVDEGILRRLANKVSRRDQVVSVSFVSKKEIRELNRRYRKKNRPTDVLSFGLGEDGMLGDVIICPSVAKMNAKEYGMEYMEEISRLFVHGLLHLIGYEHGKKMFDLQDRILAGKGPILKGGA